MVQQQVTLEQTPAGLAAHAGSPKDQGTITKSSWSSAIRRLYQGFVCDCCLRCLVGGCVDFILVMSLRLSFRLSGQARFQASSRIFLAFESFFFFLLAAVIMRKLFSECQKDLRAAVFADISQCVCLEMKAFTEQYWSTTVNTNTVEIVLLNFKIMWPFCSCTTFFSPEYK